MAIAIEMEGDKKKSEQKKDCDKQKEEEKPRGLKKFIDRICLFDDCFGVILVVLTLVYALFWVLMFILTAKHFIDNRIGSENDNFQNETIFQNYHRWIDPKTNSPLYFVERGVGTKDFDLNSIFKLVVGRIFIDTILAATLAIVLGVPKAWLQCKWEKFTYTGNLWHPIYDTDFLILITWMVQYTREVQSNFLIISMGSNNLFDFSTPDLTLKTGEFYLKNSHESIWSSPDAFFIVLAYFIKYSHLFLILSASLIVLRIINWILCLIYIHSSSHVEFEKKFPTKPLAV